jgi:hypothetical protein
MTLVVQRVISMRLGELEGEGRAALRVSAGRTLVRRIQMQQLLTLRLLSKTRYSY